MRSAWPIWFRINIMTRSLTSMILERCILTDFRKVFWIRKIIPISCKRISNLPLTIVTRRTPWSSSSSSIGGRWRSCRKIWRRSWTRACSTSRSGCTTRSSYKLLTRRTPSRCSSGSASTQRLWITINNTLSNLVHKLQPVIYWTKSSAKRLVCKMNMFSS